MPPDKHYRTLGEMIAELESDLESYRKANEYLSKWKMIYDTQPDSMKSEMIFGLLVDLKFTEEEISQMLKI